jgi:capsular exopolysaccharide synthesis family protein
VVGHIPEIQASHGAGTDSQVAGILCTYHAPMSSQSEAFRGVRTTLFFNAAGNSHQIIQVTSPAKGDGKSTLSANLSVAIARSGKQVLLVDADMRRPTQHKIFAKSRDAGLSTVVRGEAELADAIQQTPVANLSLMTSGPRSDNPSELLTSPQFAELLEVLRDRYDFVIIDTPPLGSVSDPSAVAPRADGVLLTIRIRKNARTSAAQACGKLRELGAKVIGVVVNGVGSRHSLGYGYGYDYSYGHGYGLTDANEETKRPTDPVSVGA